MKQTKFEEEEEEEEIHNTLRYACRVRTHRICVNFTVQCQNNWPETTFIVISGQMPTMLGYSVPAAQTVQHITLQTYIAARG